MLEPVRLTEHLRDTPKSENKKQTYWEEWGPTLWEMPLQPLPKRHKAHWDPQVGNPDKVIPTSTTSTGEPGGNSQELIPVCSPRQYWNLYLHCTCPRGPWHTYVGPFDKTNFHYEAYGGAVVSQQDLTGAVPSLH